MRTRTNVLSIKKEALLILGLLICVAAAAPLICKQQLITGTVVNACLILGVYFLGTREGLLIGIIPSLFALATGLLPAVMAPMVPFIIVGNVILVLTFAYLHKFNIWGGIFIGSLLKFAFLYTTSIVVIGLLINRQIAPVVSQTMSWPQLVTALSGGMVAYGIVRFVRRWNSNTTI